MVKDVDKRQLLYTVGGNINWLKYHMIQKFYFWIYTGRKWSYYPEKVFLLPRSLQHFFFFFYNNQDMETT